MPDVPFSAVEQFKGDDQLGAALTRQIVPLVAIPEQSTDALIEVGAPNPISRLNAAVIDDSGARTVETDSAVFTDNTGIMGGLGLIDPQTDPNSEVSPEPEPEPFALVDQFGQPLAQESAKPAPTDSLLASPEQATSTPVIGVDAAGGQDGSLSFSLDSDATKTLASESADSSTAAGAARSIEGPSDAEDTAGQDTSYSVAVNNQSDIDASIQVIEALSSNGVATLSLPLR